MIDFTSASVDFSLIYPEISLLVATFAILLCTTSRVLGRLAFGLAVAGLAVSLYFICDQWTHQMSGFFGMITCDQFGITFKLIFAGSSMLAVLIARRFIMVRGIDKPEYYALILLSTFGMMVMANSTDMVVIFIGLEVMSVPLYVLAGFARRSLASNEAGIKYFIMGAFASAFLLMGIAFIFGATATTDLRRIAANFDFFAGSETFYLYSGAALVLVGFAFKVAAVPFHSWVPDVYQGAPTPVTAFFSIGPKAAAFAVLLRIFMFGLNGIEILSAVFWVLAVLTMTVGNVLALRQNNVKRMLAYSSIAHAGYILVAFAVGGDEAIASTIVYLVGYALFNTGAFAVIIMMESRPGCTSEFPELNGLARHRPYLGAVLALFMFALAGFPATIGFIGKFYIFSSAVKQGFIYLAVIGVLNSFVSVYYYLRVVKAVYFEEGPAHPQVVPLSLSAMTAIVIAAIGTVGFGLFPHQILQMSRQAIFAFL